MDYAFISTALGNFYTEYQTFSQTNSRLPTS